MICDYLVTCQPSCRGFNLDRNSRVLASVAPPSVDQYATATSSKGTVMTVRLGDTAPDFTADTTQGEIHFHDWLGDSWGVLFSHPEGLHPGVHHRARLRRQDQAGVRQAQREGDRPVGRSRRQPRQVGRRHRRDPGHAGELPDDRRPRSQGCRPLRHDPPQRQRHHDRAFGVRHRPRQEGQADPHLPGLDRSQLRRDPARDRQLAVDRQVQGGHPGQLDRRRRRDHRPAVTNEEAEKLFPQGWKTVKPYLRVLAQPNK